MNNQTRIKLGSVTNLSDARYAAAVGITYIGFCFDPASVFYIPPVKAKEIIDWLSGSNIVAEFGGQSVEEIKDLSALLSIDAVEVENTLAPEKLLSIELPVIKRIDISRYSETDLLDLVNKYKHAVAAFHVYSSEQLVSYSDEFIKDFFSKNKVIWGLPLQSQNAQRVVETFQPFAIHLMGAEEERPGMKDFDELNNIVDILLPQD